MSIDWEPLLTAENHNADSIVLDVTAFHHFNLTTPTHFLSLQITQLTFRLGGLCSAVRFDTTHGVMPLSRAAIRNLPTSIRRDSRVEAHAQRNLTHDKPVNTTDMTTPL